VEQVRQALEEKPAPVDAMVNVTGISPEYDELMKDIKESKLASAKQRKEDKAYAMIMAGVATMGGESPNAFTNIAKGQAAGLGMLQENRKQSAAEDARLMQMQGTVLRYKDANDIARQAQEDRKDYKDKLVELKTLQEKDTMSRADEERKRKIEADLDKKRNNLRGGLTQYEKMVLGGAESEYKNELAAASKIVLPDEQQAAIAKAEAKLAQAKANFERDPIVIKHKKALFPDIDWESMTKPTTIAAPKVDTTGFKRVK
jgi:hypothetical protein